MVIVEVIVGLTLDWSLMKTKYKAIYRPRYNTILRVVYRHALLY